MARRDDTARHYAERINRVLSEAHRSVVAGQDADLHALALARLAGFSPHHFSRVFSAIVGESASQFVRRLRLERAARDLAETDAQIIQVAMNAGYSAHGPFTRAFRAHFGISPSEYRADPLPPAVLRPALCGVHFDPSQVNGRSIRLASDEPFISPVTVRTLPPVVLAGKPFPDGYDRLAPAVHEVMAAMDRCNSPEDACTVTGITLNRIGPESTGFHLCVGPNAPECDCGAIDRMHAAIERAGGAYAVGVFAGPYESLDHAYAWMFSRWERNAGYTIDGRDPFEVYLNDPVGIPRDEILTAVHIPVAPVDDATG